MVTNLDTVLIAAAGHGTRFFGASNANGKLSIEVCGDTLFGHLIRELRLAGIENLVISANPDNWRNFDTPELHRDFNIDIQIDRKIAGVRRLYHTLEDVLPEQYLLLFSHQPLTADYLKSALAITTPNSFFASIYADGSEPKPRADLNDDNSIRFEDANLGIGYIAQPLVVLGGVMARLTFDDGFKKLSEFYIKQASEMGFKVVGSKAAMPDEIDYRYQLPEVEQFVRSKLKVA